MKTVILGHVGADFDCVASMAGLSRLYAGAVPVLPTSLEPNVEEFLRLYEGRFRFLRTPVTEIMGSGIETAILADTIVPARLGEYGEVLSLPGIRIVAYDHHEPSSASIIHLDEGHIQKCGATASLVTASLREQQIPVNTDEATLLALGIYEDTGSLLFPETTAFDVEQAAYLLKAGANLYMVARYVTTYLTPNQQHALETALNSVQMESVAGASVAFAVVHADRNVGNLSVIVHRLAQIVRAEALFLLYQTPQTLYVLGRSDRFLNVAELLAPFGGAGRVHAAACILHDGTTVEAARGRIVQALAERRAQRHRIVQEIMTPHPVTITDDRPAREALETMVHLGFSGLPVTKEGRIVGTVTKKALEKTSLLRLEQKPVRYFVNPKVPFVEQQATVEELVQAFNTYNTGLLLVQGHAQQLIGVISRSDVLRYLNSTAHVGRITSIDGARKITAQEIDHLGGAGTAAVLTAIGNIGDKAGNRAYLVGGSVRDILLGKKPHDFDIVTERDVSGVASTVAAAFHTDVLSYGRFMTHKIHIDGREYDFAGARLEYYDFPGSLPTVAPASLVKDLLRRDFTINALAMSLSAADFGTVIDAIGGQQDLASGIIRITYPDSFIEDPARILRAIVTQARFDFSLGEETRTKAREALELGLLNVRRNKRAQDELKELLIAATCPASIRLLDDLGSASIGLPLHRSRAQKLDLLRTLQTVQSSGQHAEGPSWLAPLLLWIGEDVPPADLRAILKDFGLSDHAAEACRSWRSRERALRVLLQKTTTDVSTIVSALERLPSPVIAILEARLIREGRDREQAVLANARTCMAEPPLVTGADLLALGIREGKTVGDFLAEVRERQLNGQLHSREEALAFLRTIKG